MLALVLAATVMAGCLDDEPDEAPPADDAAPLPAVLDLPSLTLGYGFEESVVDAAVGTFNDLYEPTMEVSPTGVIYVTGHSILVDSTGAPVFGSWDDGATWSQLPFTQSVTMPADIHGATPPPSDEIFLVAGEDGQLWGVDITLLTFPVNGWCDDGRTHCYHNPNAYDEAQAMASRGEALSGGDASSCSLANLNDRPWVAYGDGKLLMVNNPGGGPVQVGIMDVPTLPVGGPGLGLTLEPVAAQWNLCAGEGSGAIPGIPEMRDDHLWAVPQVQGDKLVIVKGQGTVAEWQQVTVFENTNSGGGTSNYGHVVFDADGTLFVGIRNNTQPDDNDDVVGRLHLAISRDDGNTFTERTFTLSSPARSIYLDGNLRGPGALLTWAQETERGTDWYAAHLFVGPDGGPVIENVMLVVKDGPPPSAHVQGAAVGPDGRAYLVTFHGGYLPTDRATPIHVWIQREGPTLAVAA